MWQAIGASAIGTGHIRSGKPCQDYHGYRILDDCIIAAVADGLGSASKSEEGSRLAVNACLEYLENTLDLATPDILDLSCNIMRHAFLESKKVLRDKSLKENRHIREYATTMLILVAFPDLLITGHIGDGGIVGMKQDKTILTLSPPIKMEYVNDVIPLTSKNMINNLRIFVYEDSFSAIAMFTDGIQNMALFLAENTPHSPFFSPFFHAITKKMDTVSVSQDLADFLMSEKVCKRTDDDKTLLVLGRI